MKIPSTRRKVLSTAVSALAVVGISQTVSAQNESQNTTSGGNTTTSQNTTDASTEADDDGNTTNSDGSTNSTSDDNETASDGDDEVSEDDTENQPATEDADSSDVETCAGAPTMSRTSVTSPQKTITAERPAVVEANFRVDPTVPEECTVNIDLQYSFSQSGFQFGGGSGWEQAATDIVANTFNDVESGEIRSIDAQIHTNGAEAGDQVTVVADYEIWYEGNRDESFQQSGIRETVEVEAVNRPESTDTSESSSEDSSDTGDGEPDGGTDITVPGFGVSSSVAALGSVGYMIKRRLGADD